MRRLDLLKHDIDNFKAAWPELAEDVLLQFDTIDGELGVREAINELIAAREDNTVLLVGAKRLVAEWRKRITRFKHRDDGFRAGIKMLMEALGIRKLETPTASIWIKKNQAGLRDLTGANFRYAPPNLKDEFVKRVPAIGKIRAAILAGETVEGYALSNAEPSLVISPAYTTETEDEEDVDANL